MGCCRVGLRGDVDHHVLRAGIDVGRVVDADVEGAAGKRAVGNVLVGKTFDQALDRLGSSTGIEGNGEGSTIGTVGRAVNRTDHGAAIGNAASGNTDLTRARARIADRELVIDAPGGTVIGDLQRAAVKASGVVVVELHRTVDNDPGLGLALSDIERGSEIRQGDAGRRIAVLYADLYVGYVARTAIAVEEAKTHVAIGSSTRRGSVLVGNILQQCLHRFGRGIGVEADLHHAAARSISADRTDHRATEGDVGAREPDPADTRAFVTDTQGLACGRAVEQLGQQAASIEICRVEVADAHIIIDDLGTAAVAGIAGIVGEIDNAGYVIDDWACAAACQICRAAEHLLLDRVVTVARIVGVIDVVVIGIHDHIVAATEIGHSRGLLGAVGGRLELALAIDGIAGCVVFADVDVLRRTGAGKIVACVVPGHHEAAGIKASYARFVLVTRGRFIDLEFGAHPGTRGIETLAVDTITAAILPARRPHHHVTTIVRNAHHRTVFTSVIALVAGGIGVHLEGGAEGAVRGVVNPCKHAVEIAVEAAGVGPRDQHLAVCMAGYRGHVLGAGLRGAGRCVDADAGLAGYHGTCVVIALEIDVLAGPSSVARGGIHHHETVTVGGHRVVILRTAGLRVDREIAANGIAAGVEALGLHAPATAVRTVVILPGNNEASVGQPRDVRPILRADRTAGIDEELAAYRYAGRTHHLPIDTPTGTILGIGGPHHHIAAPGKLGRLRIVKRVRCVGAHGLFTMHRGSAVEIKRDVDGNGRRFAEAAIAVGDADGNGPQGVGIGGGGCVGEVLNDRLDGIGRGVAVKADTQVATVGAATDGADDYPTVAHQAAAHANLAGSAALVTHRKLVSRFTVLDVIHLEPAAVEIGGIRIGEAHRHIDELRRGIHIVFEVADAGGKVGKDRIGALACQIGSTAEEILEDLVAVVAAIAGAVVATVGDDKVAVTQIGHCRLVLLIARRAVVAGDQPLPVNRVTRSIVFADVHVLIAARP